MDTKLRDWIVMTFKETPERDRRAFLKVLKNTPEATRRFFENNLLNMATCAAIKTGSCFCHDNSADAAEITEHFKTVFAKEISSL